jgi:hypothetical protein
VMVLGIMAAPNKAMKQTSACPSAKALGHPALPRGGARSLSPVLDGPLERRVANRSA